MRGASRRLVLLLAMPLIAWLALSRSPATEAPSARGRVDPQLQYVGVGGCAAMACHGGTRPNERGEYTTWIQHDRHARAFSVLYDDQSQRIATNLRIERPEQDNRCLVCHSTAADRPRGPKFAVEDGVNCEACHGPAEKWLVPHVQPEWRRKSPQEKHDTFGMANTKDVVVRATVCVQCHVGTVDREVNHDLIAAGHPPLVFELDAFTANMPPHWRETPDKPTTFGAQAWAVGQVVALKQSLDLLRAQTARDQWPEFAQFECYACHHELKDKSWRQQVGYGDRRPGGPVWSSPQWLIAQRLAASAGKSPPGTDDFKSLRDLLSRPNSAAGDVTAAATKAASAADQIVRQVAQENWEPDRLRRLLADLAAEPDPNSLDYATAAHITMALGAVFEALARGEAKPIGSTSDWSKQNRPALDRLYDDVQEPAKFDASKFAADLKNFRSAIAR